MTRPREFDPDKAPHLFEKVLRQYGIDRRPQINALLQQDGDGIQELRAFFTRAVNAMTSQENQRGCLMCNSAIEAGSNQPASTKNFE